jgi:NAD+ kinase
MIKKIGIHGSQIRTDFIEYFNILYNKLVQLNIEIFIYKPFLTNISENTNLNLTVKGTFTSFYDIDPDLNLMICVGGDGTFLEAVSIVRTLEIPLVGVNSGRLGFLTNISKNEIEIALDDIFSGNYKIENRTLLELSSTSAIFPDFNFALNEFTVHKQDKSSMIAINTFINGKFLNSYIADGLIISTSTGSTAYSLSAGGPILVPESNSFVITPIAPHNLNARPLVVPDNSLISLTIQSRTENCLISLDHRSMPIDSLFELSIKKADFSIRMLHLPHYDFFNTLRHKLMWGVDLRNL